MSVGDWYIIVISLFWLCFNVYSLYCVGKNECSLLRVEDEWKWESFGIMLLVSLFVATFWPLVLLILPGYVPYHLGVRAKKRKQARVAPDDKPVIVS